MKGIKETKEVLAASFAFGGILASALKDGVQGSDLKVILDAVLNDAEFQKKIMEGIDGSKEVGDEIKDVDFLEGVELSRFVLAELNKLVAVLKAA